MKTFKEFQNETGLTEEEIIEALSAVAKDEIPEIDGFSGGESWSHEYAHGMYVQYIYYNDEYIFIIDDYQYVSEADIVGIYHLPEDNEEWLNTYSEMVAEIGAVVEDERSSYGE